MRIAMQQEDIVSIPILFFVPLVFRGLCQTDSLKAKKSKSFNSGRSGRVLTFILPYDMPYPLHPIGKLPAHAIGQVIDIVQYDGLVLQLAAHHARLLSETAYGAKDAIQLVVLLLHELHLALLLVRAVVILVLLRTASRPIRR
jgi:hypothetical protein